MAVGMGARVTKKRVFYAVFIATTLPQLWFF
jgi:hypothetical protein